MGLSKAANQPYPELLKQYITAPLGMKDTVFTLSKEQKQRLMQGHGFAGEPLPDVPTGDVIVGAGGLYSTPNDLLRWMQWHLDRFAESGAEARLFSIIRCISCGMALRPYRNGRVRPHGRDGAGLGSHDAGG